MEYKRGIPQYTDGNGDVYGLLAETKEACITDDEGKNLKDKLKEIQDGMHVVPEGGVIVFQGFDKKPIFKVMVDSNNNLTMSYYDNGWLAPISILSNGCTSFMVGRTVGFEVDGSQRPYTRYFVFNSPTDSNLYIRYIVPEENQSYNSAYIDKTGTWHFIKSIVSPNIATATALIEAQQEITEADLRAIKSEQEIAEIKQQIAALQAEKEES